MQLWSTSMGIIATPPTKLRKFVEASSDRTGQAMRALFSDYLECHEDWLSSSLVMTESSTNKDRTGGRYNWLTRDES